jgi:aryl-alcohol dehydrogenase-like predicted oxidoreductase
MKYRQLGNTDLNISEISIGCSGFWGTRHFSEKKASAVINEAFERGINFFDTGHNYSSFHAEPRLGRIIKGILTNNERSRLIISTKAGTTIPSTPIFPTRKVSFTDFSPDYIEHSCLKSISNLNCDYLDIFQLHGINQSQITEPLIERLLIMKENGMFRYLGINTHNEGVMEFISKRPELFDMVLIDYNVLQLDREPIICKLYEAGIGVVAGTVLAQGHLVHGKIGSIKTTADVWYFARALLKSTGRILSRNSKEMRQTLSMLNDMTAAQAAFAYVLDNVKISSCVFGTTNLSNLHEIINSSDLVLKESNKLLIQKTFKALKENISV